MGIGDSTGVKQIGIVRVLTERRTKVSDPFELKGVQIDPRKDYEYTERVVRRQP